MVIYYSYVLNIRRWMLKYLGVKCHDICNLFLSGSEKTVFKIKYVNMYTHKYTRVYTYIVKQIQKKNVNY